MTEGTTLQNEMPGMFGNNPQITHTEALEHAAFLIAASINRTVNVNENTYHIESFVATAEHCVSFSESY